MRPLRLHVQAFGPYPGRLELDFADLGDRRFFLIHGPTGAGKTSILDALCFALYGDSSGGERSGRQMRSDHADPACLSEAELDFAIGPRRYRVRRAPQQERPARKGTGMVRAEAEAGLWRLDAGEPELMASGVSAVDAEIRTLLGFSSEEFRQVVLLPQGRFREVLTANSGERQRILDTLFQTEMYRRIEIALREQAEQQRREAEMTAERRRTLLGQANADSVADLEARRDALIHAAAEAAEHRRHTQDRAMAAQAALEAARDLQQRLDECAQARAAVAALAARGAEMAAREQDLAASRRAETLAGHRQALEQQRGEAVQAEQGLVRAQAALGAAQTAAAQAKARLAAEEARLPEHEKARREIDRLQAATAQLAGLLQARSAAGERAAAADHWRQTRDGAAADVEALAARMQQLSTQVAQCESVAVTAALRRSEADALRETVVLRRRLDQAAAARAKADAEVTAAETAFARAEAVKASRRNTLAELEQVWRQEQAAALAQHLHEGAPCPVCGSATHPHPAVPSAGRGDAAGLEQARAALAAAERDAESARTQCGNARRRLDAAAVEADLLVSQLAAAAAEPCRDLEARLAELEREASAAERRGTEAAALRSRLEAAQRDHGAAVQRATEATEALREADMALAAARATLDERERGLAPELREPAALKTALAAAQQLLAGLDAALEHAKTAGTAAAQALERSLAAHEAAAMAHDRQRARLAAQESDFARRLADAGFAGMVALTEASRTAAWMAATESALSAYRADLKAAEVRLARAEAAAEGLTAPDMADVQAAAAAARSEADRAIAAEAAMAEEMRGLAATLAGLAEIERQLAAAQQAIDVIDPLARAVQGNNPLRLSLQRYVLASLLDNVLVAANHRLTVMTAGRFHLQRAAGGPTDRRAMSGLDVEVFDSYTGTTRAVGTLSGGEGFMAALALALGLADEVQRRAGGTRLETIFIDEGFGSLDPDALDGALQALLDLQGSGRLVGIISHVGDLRERIDARLEVRRTARGSSAAFVVGAG
jgi:exonuclease SbcC